MDEVILLLDNYWILRETDPENYYRIKDKEPELRTFFREKLGYTLVINPHLIRVTKIPGEAQAWMGINDFISPLDYSFLYLVLAFLEDKGAEDQFVLSELTEYMVSVFPGDDEIDWTLYQQRRSLVRVLQHLRELGCLKINDGREQNFSENVEAEVLYESTGLSRYFLPSFSADITAFHSGEQFLQQEWGELAEDRGLIRRHRVYRKLLLSPAVYAQGADDPDLQYLRSYGHIVERDVNTWLGADMHLHRLCGLLVFEEKRLLRETFPQTNNLSDIVLKISEILKEGLEQGRWKPENGTINMIEAKFHQMIAECHQRFSPAWYKTYREKPLDKLATEVLEYMENWEMVSVDPIFRTVTIYPLAVKLVGEYPENFDTEGETV